MARTNRGNRAQVKSIPSPVGGWNARDPLPNMKPDDAVYLDNFFCTPYDVMVRKGYTTWSTGYPAAVNTLSVYKNQSTSNKLFAFSNNNVYDATASGAVGSAIIQGNASDYWRYVNFANSGGLFQIACNNTASDLPLIYDGTAWGNAFPAAFTTTISTLTSVSTTATCTMTTAHNLKTGMSVVIAGCTPSGYNGTYVITVTSSTAFTYTLSGALGVVTVLGTATPSVNFAITGVNPNTFICPMVFKTRLFFIERNSLHVWYMPTLSIGGAANQLDFGPLCNKGGRLVSMCDWSLDAGQGMDDYAAFVTSEGQVVIYKGTDPASSATWSLVGVFDLGSPVGSNPFLKYAGDVLLICQDGVQPLSKALMSTRVNSKTALTEKIMYKMSDSITNYGSFVGWQLELFPRENMLILNIPTSSTTFIQYVMNTISGAWSSFSSWNSYCYELFGDNLYFGGVNYVALAWNGPSDNGSQINFNAQQSYNYLGSHQYKKVNMIRPIVSTDGAPSLLIGVNADYDTTNPVGIVTLTPTTASTWDNANWDFGVWGGDLSIQKNWQTAFTLGYAISAHMTGATITCYMRWAATDILFEEGGFI